MLLVGAFGSVLACIPPRWIFLAAVVSKVHTPHALYVCVCVCVCVCVWVGVWVCVVYVCVCGGGGGCVENEL